MLERFLSKIEFSDLQDFRENLKIKVPENFNFAYDVVDEWAKIAPQKIALCWCNDKGEHANFTFDEIRHYSDITEQFVFLQLIFLQKKILFIGVMLLI